VKLIPLFMIIAQWILTFVLSSLPSISSFRESFYGIISGVVCIYAGVFLSTLRGIYFGSSLSEKMKRSFLWIISATVLVPLVSFVLTPNKNIRHGSELQLIIFASIVLFCFVGLIGTYLFAQWKQLSLAVRASTSRSENFTINSGLIFLNFCLSCIFAVGNSLIISMFFPYLKKILA
jgi:hypothetical protein